MRIILFVIIAGRRKIFLIDTHFLTKFLVICIKNGYFLNFNMGILITLFILFLILNI